VHNTLSVSKADTLALNEEVTVNVYLGKGNHYLFSCADGYNYDVTALTGVTDFCIEIPTL
jgi:hypothetical protein